MRRQAQSGRSTRRQVSEFKSIAAPVGGWNARDALAEMPPTDAVELENWFPRVTDVAIRGGQEDHLRSVPSRVKSLHVYDPQSGNAQMFAATDGGIYSASTGGVAGASLSTSTNGRWQSVMFGLSGSHFLLMANGVQAITGYNGSAWSNPAITGLTPANIIHLNVFKRRLYLIEKQKLGFWHMDDVDAMAGAATYFSLGALFGRGGYTMAMATWTIDGGAGPDDFACFVSSKGEIAVFKGSDPADSTNWSLVGVYYIAEPLGRNCFIKLGGDLVLLTLSGAYPLSRALTVGPTDPRIALTNKIQNAFTEAARIYGGNAGWQGTIFPAQSALLYNVPIGPTTHEQYVMNLVTRNWCRFTGWDAECFTVFNQELYFGTATGVQKAWVGRADKGLNITARAQTAFSYFGTSARTKHFKLMRPQLIADGDLNFSVGLAINFEKLVVLSPALYSIGVAGVWDVSLWDVATWGGTLEIRQEWQTPSAKMGACASGLLLVATNQLEIIWVAMDYLYELGGPLA